MKLTKKDIYGFFIIIFCTVGLYSLITNVLVYGLNNTKKNLPKQVFQEDMETEDELDLKSSEKTEEIIEAYEGPKKINFLVVGADQVASLTDTIIIGSFDLESSRIDLINIPRDTYVNLSSETKRRVTEIGNKYDDPCKINAIYSFAGGSKGGITYLENQIEDMLNITIDYYAVINTDAFKLIVDTVGGINYNVKQDMYYNDPLQNLHINLKKGYQLLDGDKAEQLFRFRGTYIGGDLERISVQQDFMKEFFRQVINKDNIMSNLLDYAAIFVEHVSTNFGLDDLPYYVSNIKKVSPDNIHFHTLPGKSQIVNDASYLIYDKLEGSELINEVFYKNEKEKFQKSSKNLKIKILNGSGIAGFAGSKREELFTKGFTKVDIGTYEHEKKPETRINVKENGIGNDLLSSFDDAVIQVDPEVIDEGYDIIIITGTNEK